MKVERERRGSIKEMGFNDDNVLIIVEGTGKRVSKWMVEKRRE